MSLVSASQLRAHHIHHDLLLRGDGDHAFILMGSLRPRAREAAAGGTETAEGGPGGAAADSKTIEEWYQAFLNYEKERRAELPQGLPDKDTPFDILLLNICSLSNDDLVCLSS